MRKHSWIRSDKRLIELVRDGLSKGEYPLFVAEGDANKKLTQIQRSGYLSYCLGKLERIQQTLVVFGSSLGQSDNHIANVLADNPDLEKLYVGVHDDLGSSGSRSVRQSVTRILQRRERNRSKLGFKPLIIEYYDSRTAQVWD